MCWLWMVAMRDISILCKKVWQWQGGIQSPSSHRVRCHFSGSQELEPIRLLAGADQDQVLNALVGMCWRHIAEPELPSQAIPFCLQMRSGMIRPAHVVLAEHRESTGWHPKANGLSAILMCRTVGTKLAPDSRHNLEYSPGAVSYTHLRAHETDSYLVCRLLL